MKQHLTICGAVFHFSPLWLLQLLSPVRDPDRWSGGPPDPDRKQQLQQPKRSACLSRVLSTVLLLFLSLVLYHVPYHVRSLVLSMVLLLVLSLVLLLVLSLVLFLSLVLTLVLLLFLSRVLSYVLSLVLSLVLLLVLSLVLSLSFSQLSRSLQLVMSPDLMIQRESVFRTSWLMSRTHRTVSLQ